MEGKDCSEKYQDIIHLPHHISKTRPQMSMHDRAAQFSPFAALTGFGAEIKKTARRTEEKRDLYEEGKENLEWKLWILLSKLKQQPMISVTYFKKDEYKKGGTYQTAEGRIQKIDSYENIMIMENHSRIPIEDIVEIDSDLFRKETFGEL